MQEIKEVVKEKYGQAALRVKSGDGNSCCGGSAMLEASCDPITSNLYDATQGGEVPDTALKASLGCGNPTALAELKPGETVLDLGSGGGIDVLLSARRVGPSARVRWSSIVAATRPRSTRFNYRPRLSRCDCVPTDAWSW